MRTMAKGMNDAFMLLQRHGWDIHVVSTRAGHRSRRRDAATTLTTTTRRHDEMTFWLILVTKRLASGDRRHSRFGKAAAGFLAEVPRA